METSTIHLAAWVVALLGGTAIPILTAMATKLSATPGKKALVALALTALITVLAEVVGNEGSFVPAQLLALFAATFVTQVSSYHGAWKPLGGGTAPGAKATAEVGIG